MAFKKPMLPKASEAELFINKASVHDYSALSLDELVIEFESITHQSQILQGKILLAAREHFRSDKLFGQWCTQALYLGSQPHRTKLMNLARFFDDNKPLDKISVTAAYEISAPINADVAKQVYESVKGKNMQVADVKKEIARAKGESVKIEIGNTLQKVVSDSIVTMPEKIEIIATEELKEKSKYDLIMEVLQGLTGGEAKKLLRDCMHAVKW